MSIATTRRPRASAAAIWAPLARFIEKEAQLGHWAGKRRATAFLYEFACFGVKRRGPACLMVAAVNRPERYRPAQAPIGTA